MITDSLVYFQIIIDTKLKNIFQHDDVIDLVIPRGSNKLVSQVKNLTKIPVLGHAG